MDSAIVRIFEALVSLGPTGIAIAACLVGLVLAVIIMVRLKQLIDNTAAEQRIATFQSSIMDELSAARIRDQEQRRVMDQQGAAIDQLQAQLFLFREQVHRLIDLLNHVKQGRIAPGDIEIPDKPK